MMDPRISNALKIAHTGAIRHESAGRADHVAIDVPEESTVIPADVVSGIGEGNTENGLKILTKMFGDQPSAAKGVPIYAAGGEFVVSPEEVKRRGGGDIKKGHKAINDFITHARKEIIKTMAKLKGPHK